MQLPALQARTFDLPRISQAAANVRGTNALTRHREAITATIPQESRAQLMENVRLMSAEERARSDHIREQFSRSVAYIEGLPELARPGAYAQELERLAVAGVDTGEVPQEYSPEVLARAKAMTADLDKLFEEADAGGYKDIADPTKHGLPKGSVAQRGPKGKLSVVYKPGGGKDGASIMERLRWMYAFGEDPENPGKKLNEEARAMAGKALAPGSADTPDEFERNIYETLRRGFSGHDEALEEARKARGAFFGNGAAGGGGANAVSPAKGAEPAPAPAFDGPLPPDVPIAKMSVEQVQDFLEARGDGLSDAELRELRDRLKELTDSGG